MKRSLFPAAATALLWPFAAEAACISADEAQRHVSENTCVCGVVVSSRYASGSNRQPTFLNLDKPYPNQIFTALVWGSDRPKFGEPEKTLMGKRICVTGPIELYREKPEIILHDPGQLTEQKPGP